MIIAIKDEKGQVGNELLAVILRAFVFAVIVYIVLSVVTDKIVGLLRELLFLP